MAWRWTFVAFLAVAKDPETGRIYYEDYIALLVQSLTPKKL